MTSLCACSNLRRAARAVTQVYDAYLDEAGLKATQFTLLTILSYTKDRPQPVSSLAEALVLDQSSLSRNLAVLAKIGYLTFQPGEDRRERLASLTPTGRAALARAFPAWNKAQAAIAESVDPALLAAQLRALRQLTKTALSARPVGKRLPASAGLAT